jgi:hypothetical protein
MITATQLICRVGADNNMVYVSMAPGVFTLHTGFPVSWWRMRPEIAVRPVTSLLVDEFALLARDAEKDDRVLQPTARTPQVHATITLCQVLF